MEVGEGGVGLPTHACEMRHCVVGGTEYSSNGILCILACRNVGFSVGFCSLPAVSEHVVEIDHEVRR